MLPIAAHDGPNRLRGPHPADFQVARHRQAEIIRSLGKSEQHACISSSSLIVLPAKGIFDGATS
jgi:hypothetical protein